MVIKKMVGIVFVGVIVFSALIVVVSLKYDITALRAIAEQQHIELTDISSLITTTVPTRRAGHENVSYTPQERQNQYSGYVSYPDKVPLILNCSTCAFVVGSGHLLGSKKGSEIDSMDCVIRSNDAPTLGFEADVGSKTTIRTVDRRSMEILWRSRKRLLKFDESTKKTPPIIVSIFHPPTIEREYEKAKKVLPHLRLYASTTSKFEELFGIYQNRVSSVPGMWYSNGFRTIYFAHEVCKDVIHVYGVNDENFCKHVLAKDPGFVDVAYHYYGYLKEQTNCGFMAKHDKRKTQGHAFTKEKILFRKLMDEWGNLHFHVPTWTNKTQEV